LPAFCRVATTSNKPYCSTDPDLSLLPGSTVSFPAQQRETLGTLATPKPSRRGCAGISNNPANPACGTMISSLSATPNTTRACTADSKGWCASIRWSHKVIPGDFMNKKPGFLKYDFLK